jgi:hypothetical protein
LKCYLGEEISVLTVPHDIKFRHLRAKIEEKFGEGVAIHKYEDHVGDLITVHSKQDVREAFTLYAKAIRKQSKRDSVEPYLKLHLVKEDRSVTLNLHGSSGNGGASAAATPGTTPPGGISATVTAISTPVQRRRSSKEKDKEAREEKGGVPGHGNGYNRPISKSSPVLPSRMSKSPPESPPEQTRQRQSWSRAPKKERDATTSGGSTGSSPAGKKRSSGKERSMEKKEKRRKKRISWKDSKGKLIERRTEDGERDREESEGEEGGGSGISGAAVDHDGGDDAGLRRELSGSGGRGRSFIRRLTPTKKKIERTRSADDRDEVVRSEVGDDIRHGGRRRGKRATRPANEDGAASGTESECADDEDVEIPLSPRSTIGDAENDDGDDVASVDGAEVDAEVDGDGVDRILRERARVLAEEASTESGESTTTESEGEAELKGSAGDSDDEDSDGSESLTAKGIRFARPHSRKQQVPIYSPLVQHLPSGSPPVVPTPHEPLSAAKRMKLTIKTDMEELNWDVPAKALKSSRYVNSCAWVVRRASSLKLDLGRTGADPIRIRRSSILLRPRTRHPA